MSDVYSPKPEVSERAWIKTMDQYKKMYERSVKDPEGFWAEWAETFHWEKKWDKVLTWDFDKSIKIEWFKGGKTNACYNALDRNLKTRGDRVAYYWEGNTPGEQRTVTYKELHEEVCKFANVLKSKGVKKGDRVSIYMPMVMELTVAVLACARIGAVHSVVFGGFSADSLADRILDSDCKTLLTTNAVYRGAKAVPLKSNADKAMAISAEKGCTVNACIVYNRVPDMKVEMKKGRDYWWNEEMDKASADCPVEWMDAEDTLFILYTSGSTGKPKGVAHTVGGYMVYTAHTFKYIFDYHDDDIFWCTADIGWVTGHSYIVYGPLAMGATSVMFEGIPTYPDAGRFWDVVDKYKVTIFYTAPTAIRAIAAQGNEHVTKRSRKSLRLLGSVGEPINPEAWRWYYEVVGDSRCPIVDTWWQTETGGILITPLPGSHPLKPGSATLPYFGCQPLVLDEQGKELHGAASGILAIRAPWPGIMRTVYGDHKRFKETYFSAFPGLYFTGDGCRRDEDGYYWITGRVDDVINVSGHRMGTAEVESALVSHPKVAEAAVVGFPHNIKGEGIYAYVTLNIGVEYTDELKKELRNHVRDEIGPIASPDVIHWAPGLPKTRSGKIMRRILRKIASGDMDQIGDTSTLADPAVVDTLVANKE
ncbi:MAG: acetate--CoA ligase [Candidatus Eisenbacteria bacterium]|uniref:Acetyl-coenzyme A synthetase n=1 Tax=Eiseniibacteriota bacterium TaxID=2212470 RepID=A0A948W598_UNCEI|nr:acetate--CoA ligase [Candidatus Eisenbacteria bacterium]MBU2690174.1 acetate--CoA ligase [Candidatus Eisenbacteria bacterium]